MEDQPLLALELRMVLEEAGFEVVGPAHDRDEARSLIEGVDPELALIDLNLRDGLTGPDIARDFCCRSGRAAIFLTANPDLIPPGIAGALGSLTKPVDAGTVRAAVAYALAWVRGLRPTASPVRMNLATGLKAQGGTSTA